MKKCRDCGIEKELTEFFKSLGNKDNRQTWCKKCHRVRMKKWENNNQEKLKQIWKQRSFKISKRTCEICQKEYVRNSRELGCSLKCRFLNAVTKNEETGCWEWKKSLNARGYGQMNVNGKNREMHRLGYEIFNGEISEGLYVLHKCDNRKCCNPDHLWLGTQKDNIQDMIKKGRRRAPKIDQMNEQNMSKIGKK